MDLNLKKSIEKSIKIDQRYVIDTFIKKFGEDISKIEYRKISDSTHSNKPDLSLTINSIKYCFDIKCSMDINRDTRNFTVSTKYPADTFTSENKFFAFIDTSSDNNFGNIYVIDRPCVYIHAAKASCRYEYCLISKSFIRENINTKFSVFADPEDKERLRVLTGLKYELETLS